MRGDSTNFPAPAPPADAQPAPGTGAAACLKRWARQVGPAGPVALAMVVMPMIGGAVLLGVIRDLAPWLRSHASAGSVLLAAVAVALLGGFSLVPTYALELVCGWAFGATAGLIAALAGVTAAATISYGIARAVVRDHVLESIRQTPRCEGVRRAMIGSGFARAAILVGLVRMAPVVPFGATNVLMASAGCPVAPFVVGSALGTLPRTAALVYMAAQMSELDFRQRPWLLVSGIVATAVIVWILGVLAKRALAQLTEEEQL